VKTFTILPDEDDHQPGFKAGLEIYAPLKTDGKIGPDGPYGHY